jgi:hypothetical protein
MDGAPGDYRELAAVLTASKRGNLKQRRVNSGDSHPSQVRDGWGTRHLFLGCI